MYRRLNGVEKQILLVQISIKNRCQTSLSNFLGTSLCRVMKSRSNETFLISNAEDTYRH